MSTSATYDQLLELAKQRRSHRKFKPDALPEGTIEKIVEAARWAPSGFHTQPWEFVAVTQEDVRERIVAVLDRNCPPLTSADASRTTGSFRDAPAFILTLCDWRACVGLPWKAAPDDPRTVGVFNSSMAGAFLYMHLAATALGLASQWYSASGSPEIEKEIRAIVGIPEPLKIYDLMVLGYAAGSPVPKEVRAVEALLHHDACGVGDFRTDEQVAEDAARTKTWCLSAH